MKKIIFLILILILIGNASALKLTLNPAYIEFNGKANENICSDYSVLSDYSGNIIGEIRWIREEIRSKNILDYKLSSREMEIAEDFPKEVKSNGEIIKNELCLKFENQGIYNGVLLYHTENSHAGVGIWIIANVSKDSNKRLNLITGKAIGAGQKTALLSSITLMILLVSILVYFLIKTKGKNRKED